MGFHQSQTFQKPARRLFSKILNTIMMGGRAGDIHVMLRATPMSCIRFFFRNLFRRGLQGHGLAVLLKPCHKRIGPIP